MFPIHNRLMAALILTLLLAATRGLLLDLCATGDRRRVTQALNLLARLLESKEKKD